MNLDKNIQSILKDFYTISGIRVSLHDNTFKEIYAYPLELTPFCKCVQNIPDFKKQCIDSDSQAFTMAKKTDNPYIYKCKCGLYEAVAPIYNYGRLSGYLMLGQVRDNDVKLIEKTMDILRKNNMSDSVLNDAYSSIVTLNLEKLYSYINIMIVIAKNLTLTNKFNTSEESLPFLVKKEIINNYSKELTLPYLAQKFGCSISTLTVLFKKEYNIGIHHFIIDTRLSHAKELLTNSNKAIKTISEECGFYDQNHFYRTFKKINHISPTAYRNSHKKH